MKSTRKPLINRFSFRKNNARRGTIRRRISHVESLECRSLLTTIVLMNSDLVVNGSDNPDLITVQMNGATVEVSIVDLVTNSSEKKSYSAAQVSKIVAAGRGGNDIIVNNTGITDRLFGEQGNDTLLGGSGSSLLDGGEGNDTLLGRDGIDYIFGGNGDDTLRGGNGHDWLFGDLGNDTLFGDSGNDTLCGDIFLDSSAGGGDDALYGGVGKDVLVGMDGNDVLDGGGDFVQDRLNGQDGADVFVQHGACKEDLLEDVSSSEGDTIKCASRILKLSTNDTLSGLSVLYVASISIQNGDLVAIGSDNPDLITVRMNGATVEVSIVDLVTSVTLTASFPAAQVSRVLAAGFGGDDVIVNAIDKPDFLFGGEGDDMLYGGAANSELSGGAGHDTLRGGGGHDVLVGGMGNDRLFGDAGNDSLFGDAGKKNQVVLTPTPEDDGDDDLHGGTGQDLLVGEGGNDTLDGGGDGMKDTLRGRDGADLFVQHGDGDEDLLDDVTSSEGDVVICVGFTLKASKVSVL